MARRTPRTWFQLRLSLNLIASAAWLYHLQQHLTSIEAHGLEAFPDAAWEQLTERPLETVLRVGLALRLSRRDRPDPPCGSGDIGCECTGRDADSVSAPGTDSRSG